MVKQISLHAAGNAERGAYGSKYGDNHLQDSFPNFLFHFLFPFFFLMVQQSVSFLNFRKFFPTRPFYYICTWKNKEVRIFISANFC